MPVSALDFGLRCGRRIFGHRVRPDRIILQRISGLEEIRPNDILTARIDGVVDAAYGVFRIVVGELLALEPYRTAGCVVAALHQLLVGGVDRVGRRLRRIVEVVFEIYVCRQAVHALRVERRNRDVAVLVVFEQEGVVVAQRGDAPSP